MRRQCLRGRHVRPCASTGAAILRASGGKTHCAPGWRGLPSIPRRQGPATAARRYPALVGRWRRSGSVPAGRRFFVRSADARQSPDAGPARPSVGVARPLGRRACSRRATMHSIPPAERRSGRGGWREKARKGAPASRGNGESARRWPACDKRSAVLAGTRGVGCGAGRRVATVVPRPTAPCR